MRRQFSLLRIAFFGSLAAFFAAATADCQAKTYVTCVGLCENALPPCNGAPASVGAEPPTPYQGCLDFCTAIQKKCESVGHPAIFTSYVTCATDAGFTCSEAGVPMANAPCGIAQAELIQCESADAGPDADTSLNLPDSAYAAGADCPDAGSCVACCETAYSTGAKQYREAVLSCVCGDGGISDRICTCVSDAGHSHMCTPAEACAKEVCESKVVEPMPGDLCDQCLTALLDEQQLDAGPCVLPVTDRCNGQAECAKYSNCVSQPGCTN